MRASLKIAFILMSGALFSIAAGCAPTLISVSAPEIQTAENSYYTAQFEPLAEEKNYFDSFRLKVVNKTRENLEIDWNKTRYLYNGRDTGVFVFKGIEPVNIRNLTIPPDVIPAGQTFTKEISPLKLLARAPLTSRSANAGKITTGPIPTGESGIFLFIRQGDKTIDEKMAVKITRKEVQK